MAEISGFATDLQQSAYLAHTIRRAVSAAQQRSHRYVTLEHLLLALLDDPDALALLEGARVDVAALRVAATETVNHSLATLYTPGQFDLRASYKVERVLQSAADDARRMGCREVDGAFVAVALFHETDSPAYDLLKRHNFVFHAANGWLDRNRGARAAARQQPAAEARPPLVEAPAPMPRQPAPVMEPPPVPRQAAEPAEEPDLEILLEEIVEDSEPQWSPPPPRFEMPGAPDRGHAEAAPLPAPDIEPVGWPVSPSPVPRREAEIAAEEPARPPRARTRRPETAPPPERDARREPREGPNLGSAIPRDELAQTPSWPERSETWREPSPGHHEADTFRAESLPTPAPLSEETRIEPRLSLPPEPRHSGQAARQRPAQPEVVEELDDEQIVEASYAPPSQDLGSAVPARDFTPAGTVGDAVESPPPRHHAPARERSAPAPRPAPAPAAPEMEPPAPAAPAPGRAPGGAPTRHAPAGRIEPSLPPATRLDDMRVRSAPGAPAPTAPPPPAAAKAPGKKPGGARDKDGERPSRGRRRPQSPAAVYTGKLAENIPRKMRAHTRTMVEVRISREETQSFLTGFEGTAEVFRHAVSVTQAMSVFLRAPDGGFTIENFGPETQWIFMQPGAGDKEPFGRWTWCITPTETGKRRLQLIVASRSVDENGLAGDTTLPDQVITVAVRTNYGRAIKRAFKWLLLMALGGAVTEGSLLLLRFVTG